MPSAPSRLVRRAAIAAALGLTLISAAPAHAASPSTERAVVTTGLEATARAAVWVTRDVPYSQGATFDGYRTDCSGYLSMAWGLARPGLSTYSLRRVGDFITKPQLRRGDACSAPPPTSCCSTPGRMRSRTSYWGYEESSSQGAVYRVASPIPTGRAMATSSPSTSGV